MTDHPPPHRMEAPAASLPSATRSQRGRGSGGVTGSGFRPGQSGNPRGRVPGTPNTATREARGLAQRLVTDRTYLQSLRRRLRGGTAGGIESTLWAYAFGKPKESLELTGSGITVIFESSVTPTALRPEATGRVDPEGLNPSALRRPR